MSCFPVNPDSTPKNWIVVLFVSYFFFLNLVDLPHHPGHGAQIKSRAHLHQANTGRWCSSSLNGRQADGIGCTDNGCLRLDTKPLAHLPWHRPYTRTFGRSRLSSGQPYLLNLARIEHTRSGKSRWHSASASYIRWACWHQCTRGSLLHPRECLSMPQTESC